MTLNGNHLLMEYPYNENPARFKLIKHDVLTNFKSIESCPNRFARSANKRILSQELKGIF